jgi:hypothetical protein
MVYASTNETATLGITNSVSVYGSDSLDKKISQLVDGDAFLEISGEITQSNTFGFLNAELYP